VYDTYVMAEKVVSEELAAAGQRLEAAAADALRNGRFGVGEELPIFSLRRSPALCPGGPTPRGSQHPISPVPHSTLCSAPHNLYLHTISWPRQQQARPRAAALQVRRRRAPGRRPPRAARPTAAAEELARAAADRVAGGWRASVPRACGRTHTIKSIGRRGGRRPAVVPTLRKVLRRRCNSGG
jgi:hypothetical protein